ncbi:DUF4239 domain-containing protein [Micromonospora sp. WMMA1363]|nr:DUF4239 domain-containing protein [Micromonospora sp. WMMA1363]MDM4720034.1 DUF4239 domain-containing protein [Micromonospora sp. WMMA1363]
MLLIFAFTGLAALGVLLVRSPIQRVFESEPKRHDLMTTALRSVVTFYGLLLTLTAASAYETYAEARKAVSAEAASLATLSQAVSDYPEPTRSELQGLMRDYVDYMTNEAWPAYQQRAAVRGDNDLAARINGVLHVHKPESDEEKAQSRIALAELEKFNENRQLRRSFASTELPGFLWAVLLVGAAFVVTLTWFLSAQTRRAHLVVSAAIAVIIALLLFVVEAMDGPFEGTMSVSPAPFEEMRKELVR